MTSPSNTSPARVLWIQPPGQSPAMAKMITGQIKQAGIDPTSVCFAQLTKGCMRRRTKTKWEAKIDMKEGFFQKLALYKYSIIVCNDKAALFYLTGKYLSLALCRGGIYYNSQLPNVPILVLDDFRKTRSTRHGSWVAGMDLAKLKRRQLGKFRAEPALDYNICQTEDDVTALLALAGSSHAVAIDIETTGTTISCIGYAFWTREGRIKTWVVPFYNPLAPNGAHWPDEETESRTWLAIRQLHQHPIYKVMQNGSYDSTYFIVYRCPLFNYLFDTLHLWHSIWPEAPKRLDFMSSIMLDFYKYWKDEKAEDADDKKGSQIPASPAGYAAYLMYNALDCHNTMGVFRMLCHLTTQLKWANRNYVMEFSLQFGPLQSMAMRGIKLNSDIQAQAYWENVDKSDKSLCALCTMVDQPDFNPNSPQQVETLIYDILGAAELPRKGRSTDETILKMIQMQSPLLQVIIQQIWRTKKPANNASKYGISSNISLHGRLMYGLHAGTTPTQRLASKSHNLWCGTNIQNVPKYMRSMLEADTGYLLVDIDYSQSDAYFTAFESGDGNFIRTMQGENGADTHCYHGSYFFGVEYDKLLASHQAHEDWADHPTTGIRQITKRIVYGANYFMVGYTLYIQMGHEAVVAAAKLLGYQDVDSWSVKDCANFCDKLLESYFTMYPEVESSVLAKAQAATRQGNKAATAWGYTRLFFADLINDKAALREFAAFFGQGGTAGNVNLGLQNIYCKLESRGVELLAQVHDSIICQIPETKLELIPQIQLAMENSCTIGKHTFTVPTEAAVGRGWGKRLIEYRPDLTLADIDKHDASWRAANLPQINHANRPD